MITNSKFFIGAVALTASLLFAATFYQTRNALSASPSQDSHSHDSPTLDYENEVTKAKAKSERKKVIVSKVRPIPIRRSRSLNFQKALNHFR